MRLPYVQVASEVVDGAADLSVMLDCDVPRALGMVVLIFNYALRRARDDRPPSLSDTIQLPEAAKLVARAAGWTGDPEVFISACERLPYPPLERLEDGGIRFCGLDRYDAAWLKKLPKEEAGAWRLFLDGKGPSPFLRRIGGESAPEPALNRGGTGAEWQPQTQTQTQIQTQEKKDDVRSNGDAPRENFPRTPEKPTKADDLWDGLDLWCWVQAKRWEVGLACERRPNERVLNVWYSNALMEGITIRALREAFYAFAEDPYWKSEERRPPLPFKAFMSQLAKYLPQGAVNAA